MSDRVLSVLVVDDDFMIAKLHGKFIDSQKGYKLAGTAHSFYEAIECIDRLQPDLILLDIYLPDRSGIELLQAIRTQNRRCDVIVITAAKELEIVENGFRFGIIDFLIKPFDLTQLQTPLNKYIQFKSRLSLSSRIDQETVDDFKKLRLSKSGSAASPKGIDTRTLEKIKNCMVDGKDSLSADRIAELAGVSLSTTRTYLSHLVKERVLIEEQKYGTVGRPLRLYRIAD